MENQSHTFKTAIYHARYLKIKLKTIIRNLKYNFLDI